MAHPLNLAPPYCVCSLLGCFWLNLVTGTLTLITFGAILTLGWVGFFAASPVTASKGSSWFENVYVVASPWIHIGLTGYRMVVWPYDTHWGHDKQILPSQIDVAGTTQKIDKIFITAINWSFAWLAAVMSLNVAGFLVGCCVPRGALWCARDPIPHRPISQIFTICSQVLGLQGGHSVTLWTYQTLGGLFILGAFVLVPVNGYATVAAASYAHTHGDNYGTNHILERMIFQALWPLTGLLFLLVTFRVLSDEDQNPGNPVMTWNPKTWFACLLLCHGKSDIIRVWLNLIFFAKRDRGEGRFTRADLAARGFPHPGSAWRRAGRHITSCFGQIFFILSCHKFRGAGKRKRKRRKGTRRHIAV